jgi:Tol biopolymer transport system component
MQNKLRTCSVCILLLLTLTFSSTVASSGRVYIQQLGVAPKNLDAVVDTPLTAVVPGPPHSIAFHSNSVRHADGSRNVETYVMDPDGTNQTRITFRDRADQQPDISPNGRQITFGSNRITDTNPEGDLEIFVMDADGGNVRQLTFNRAGEAWPRWSPNGKQIAFYSNVDGNFEIYLIDADGTNLTRVTDYPGPDTFPEWSPNGKQLAIARDGDIYLIEIDGTISAQLTDHLATDQMPSWSPDGNRIAFMSLRDGYCAVYVMNSVGNDLTNLTPKPDGIPNSQFCSRAPAWSRNGQQIYFSSFRPETNLFENIFVMNADGSDVTRLTFDESTLSVAAVR